MSNAVLTRTNTAIDVTALIDDLVRAFAPVAGQRGIKPVTHRTTTPVLVSTSFEEALPAFSTLYIKLLYLLPPGSRFEVMARQVEQEKQTYLRLQIETGHLYINPNLLLPDTLKILRLDNSQPNSSIIYIDLPLDTQPEPTRSVPTIKELPEILKSEKLATATQHRIKQFVQDGLTLDKVRASATVRDARFLDTAGQLIAANLGNTAFDSGTLEREMGLSRTQLFRKLKKLTGFATANYIRQVRLCNARDLLETTVLPVGEVAWRVGFTELSYFSHAFAETFGQSPSDWRKRAKMKQ
ncbi:AraC family transcriptional regulator [Spirosoma arcticum]